MIAYYKHKFDKEKQIKELQTQIDLLNEKINKIKNSVDIIDTKWWYKGLKTINIPVISGLKYKSIINIDENKKLSTNMDNYDSYDYYILLIGDDYEYRFDSIIFDTRIILIYIEQTFSSHTTQISTYTSEGTKFLTIKIKLKDKILYYKYKNYLYIEFTNDFIKEILENICMR